MSKLKANKKIMSEEETKVETPVVDESVCVTCKGTGRHLPEQTCPVCRGTGRK